MPPLPLCSPTQYAEARQYAAAAARHLGLDIDDTSTDHPSRVTASEFDTTRSARRSAEAETSTMRQTSLSPSTSGANTEWVFTVLSRFPKGKGIVVKTRKGMTTFGERLADDEIEYLHSVVRRALAGTSG